MITHRTRLIQGDDVFETAPGLENNIIWYTKKSGSKPNDRVVFTIIAQTNQELTNIPVINVDHISSIEGIEVKEIHVDNKFKTIKVVL